MHGLYVDHENFEQLYEIDNLKEYTFIEITYLPHDIELVLKNLPNLEILILSKINSNSDIILTDLENLEEITIVESDINLFLEEGLNSLDEVKEINNFIGEIIDNENYLKDVTSYDFIADDIKYYNKEFFILDESHKYITSLFLPFNNVKFLLKEYPKLKEITLENLERLIMKSNMPALEKFTVYNHHYRNLIKSTLIDLLESKFPRLKILELMENNHLIFVSNYSFENLEYVEFSSKESTKIEIKLSKNNPNLKSLQIRGNVNFSLLSSNEEREITETELLHLEHESVARFRE